MIGHRKTLIAALVIILAEVTFFTLGCRQETTAPDWATAHSGRVACTNVGSSFVVTGVLGVPVGETVVIHGTKVEGLGCALFHVDTLNDKRFDRLVTVEVHGIEHWTNGTQATVIGHEEGRLGLYRLIDSNFALNDARWKGDHQGLHMTFSIEQLKEPVGLEVRRDRVPNEGSQDTRR